MTDTTLKSGQQPTNTCGHAPKVGTAKTVADCTPNNQLARVLGSPLVDSTPPSPNQYPLSAAFQEMDPSTNSKAAKLAPKNGDVPLTEALSDLRLLALDFMSKVAPAISEVLELVNKPSPGKREEAGNTDALTIADRPYLTSSVVGALRSAHLGAALYEHAYRVLQSELTGCPEPSDFDAHGAFWPEESEAQNEG